MSVHVLEFGNQADAQRVADKHAAMGKVVTAPVRRSQFSTRWIFTWQDPAATQGAWFARNPVMFHDTRVQYRRSAGGEHDVRVVQRVRSYRGLVGRRVEGTRREEYERCGHAHLKMGAARKCAERLARRLNRSAP